jgi:thioredoxin
MKNSNLWIFLALTLLIVGFVWINRPRVARTNIEPAGDDWFQAEVVGETRPVLVKFGAEWCGPCKQLDASMDELQSKVADQIKFVRVDVDRQRQLASHYQVRGIPHSFIFHQGKIIGQEIGSMDATELQGWIEKTLRGSTEQP